MKSYRLSLFRFINDQNLQMIGWLKTIFFTLMVVQSHDWHFPLTILIGFVQLEEFTQLYTFQSSINRQSSIGCYL